MGLGVGGGRGRGRAKVFTEGNMCICCVNICMWLCGIPLLVIGLVFISLFHGDGFSGDSLNVLLIIGIVILVSAAIYIIVGVVLSYLMCKNRNQGPASPEYPMNTMVVTNVPPGYTANVQPGYPANIPPGYTANVQPGFPGNVQPGYPANVPPGYTANVQPGYPGNVQPGYTANVQPANVQTGYPANVQPGFSGNVQSGIPANVQPGIPATAPPGHHQGPDNTQQNAQAQPQYDADNYLVPTANTGPTAGEDESPPGYYSHAYGDYETIQDDTYETLKDR